MVDHFGRRAGNVQNLRGPPGESGITILCKIMPGTTISNLRRFDEEYCFTITKECKDIVDKTKWISRRVTSEELICIQSGAIKKR